MDETCRSCGTPHVEIRHAEDWSLYLCIACEKDELKRQIQAMQDVVPPISTAEWYAR